MSARLNVDDFKPASLTCELRYKNAYLIYDRTGEIAESLKEFFTDVSVSSASPAQTAFTAEEGIFNIELGLCRFTTARPDQDSEVFAEHCKNFFSVVVGELRITLFTRIGVRYILRREYKTEDESRAALAALTLANLKPTRRFNSSDSPTEVFFRWEDDQIGAFLRLKAETVNIKLAVPPELRDNIEKVDKKIVGLTLDVDYYTVAPVDREQWDPVEWLPQKLRIIRKEVDGILGG